MLEPEQLGQGSSHSNAAKKLTVYKRGAGSNLVPGVDCHPVDTMIFMPSRDACLTQLAFSEACFDANRHGGLVLAKANFTELSVDVTICQMRERRGDKQLVKVSEVCRLDGLQLRQAEKTTDSSDFGFLITDLFPPIPFNEGVWTSVEIEFVGKVKHFGGDVRVYPSSRTNLLSTGRYTNTYVESTDASINFRFRAVASEVPAEYGVIDHFSVVLPTDE